MASSTYYNISLLTSEFYGLLFGTYLTIHIITKQYAKTLSSGLFLFVRARFHIFFSALSQVLTRGAALLTVLVILPGVCGGNYGSDYILLASYA